MIPSSDLFRVRFSELVQQTGSIAELMRLTHLSRTSIDNYLSGKSEPSLTKLREIAIATNIDIGWLIGLDGTESPGVIGTSLVATDDLKKFANDPNFSLIPRYDVSASAGHGAFVDEETIIGHMAFQTNWLHRTMGVDPATLALIDAQGDSMTSTIQSGDLLLVDRSATGFEDDGIFVIGFGEYLSVKRLQINFDGSVDIKSDNPAYDTRTLDKDAVKCLRIAGRVIWFGRKI